MPNPQLPVGIWELADQEGGAIGINLWRVPASLGHGGQLLKSGEKDYPVLQIGVYQRVKAKVRCGEEKIAAEWCAVVVRDWQLEMVSDFRLCSWVIFPLY